MTVQPVYCYTEQRHETPGTKPLRRKTVEIDATVLFPSSSPSLLRSFTPFSYGLLRVYTKAMAAGLSSLSLPLSFLPKFITVQWSPFIILSRKSHAHEFLRIFLPDIATHCERKSLAEYSAVNHQRVIVVVINRLLLRYFAAIIAFLLLHFLLLITTFIQ